MKKKKYTAQYKVTLFYTVELHIGIAHKRTDAK